MAAVNTLPGLLQSRAERTPDAIALRHKVRDVWTVRTWRELRDEVSAVAAGLRSIQFGRSDRIWISTQARPEALIVALAGQWLGGAAILHEASHRVLDGVKTGLRAHTRGHARFAFVQDGGASRAWFEGEDATGIRVVYLAERGAWHAGCDASTYEALRTQGRALAAGTSIDATPEAPAILVAGAGVRQYTHLQLLAAAESSAASAPVGSEDDAYASDLGLADQHSRLLALWLQAGLRLNFAEDAGTTTDSDRRELGPNLLVSSAAEIERLRQRVAEHLPERGFVSHVLDPRAKATAFSARSRARAAVRDALGWAHVRAVLVASPLEPPAADFCAALGVPVHELAAPESSIAPEPSAHSEASASHRGVPAQASTVTELTPRVREPFLRLEHISLYFNEVKAVHDISFAVSHHEVCALIGPNGAGKSSLLNVINGIYRPQAGRIYFGGEVHSAMTPRAAARAGIARTFQNLALFKGMSVLENVLVGRNLSVRSSWIEQALWIGRARASEDASRERAEEVLEFLRLQRYRHSAAAQLPYGLQKRVELARALVADPKLLLLDEPMAGMNADEKRDMSEIILDVNRELGTTVVLIEHDMRVVMDISDHVVVLDYGRLVGDGTPAEVRQNPDVLRAYLGRKRVA